MMAHQDGALYAERGSQCWHAPEAGGKADKDKPGRARASAARHRADPGLRARGQGRSGRMSATLRRRLPQGAPARRRHRQGRGQPLPQERLSAPAQRPLRASPSPARPETPPPGRPRELLRGDRPEARPMFHVKHPVDKRTAAPRPTTSPQARRPQPKRPIHLVQKPVKSQCSRHAEDDREQPDFGDRGAFCSRGGPAAPRPSAAACGISTMPEPRPRRHRPRGWPGCPPRHKGS